MTNDQQNPASALDTSVAGQQTNTNDDPEPRRRGSSWFARSRDSIIAFPKKTKEAVKNLTGRNRGSTTGNAT
jgi:hypothetical protein